MKTAALAFPISQRALACSLLLGVSLLGPRAFGVESPIEILSKAPLSLPRLAREADKLGHKPVRDEAFEVLGLSPSGKAKQKARSGASYLEIEPGAEWQQKLRNQRSGANYVTFTLNASVGTQIDIGGATLGVESSEKDQGFAAIRAKGTDKSINHEMPFLLYGGARMAALDIVTVKVDRKAGTWAMWFRDSLVAADMPLAGRPGNAQIRITAGKGGAWLCGLVCSDENPLFEDTNDNAVPDDFERKVVGKLLSADSAEQSWAVLRAAWVDEKQTRPPSEFVLTAPLPDSFPADCAPEGQVVHGMAGGLKFGAPKKN
jgi:hypothetical protein